LIISPPLPITTPTAARGTATFNKNSDQYFTAIPTFTVPLINYNTFQTMHIKTKLHKSTTQQILQHINRHVKHTSLHVLAKDK
jgi:hypothetical protein